MGYIEFNGVRYWDHRFIVFLLCILETLLSHY